MCVCFVGRNLQIAMRVEGVITCVVYSIECSVVSLVTRWCGVVSRCRVVVVCGVVVCDSCVI